MNSTTNNEQLVDPREKAYVDKQIKKAYNNKDGDASKKYHQDKLQKHIDLTTADNETEQTALNNNNYNIEIPKEIHEQHLESEKQHKGDIADFIKSIIFGGMDGIITLFAIVASISGSDVSVEIVLVLGVAKLIGDGISMGVGDFLSEKAEIDFTKSELQREKWEFKTYKQGEINEMIEIYENEYNISKQDAELILNKMAKYPDFFINHMMRLELGLNAGCIDDNPLKNGGITFLAFLIFGMIPLLSYLIFHDIFNAQTKLIIAVILTLMSLFIMGAIKGYYTNINFFKSGMLVMLNGAFAAGSAYLIGWGLSEALGVGHHHHF